MAQRVRIGAVAPALPASLLAERTLTFEPCEYDLYSAASELLAATPALGSFPAPPTAEVMPGSEARAAGAVAAAAVEEAPAAAALMTPAPAGHLESFELRLNVFRNFKARQVLYRAVGSSRAFLEVYERLVHSVVLPAVVAWLAAAGEVDAPQRFHYQYPPTMRLQPGPSMEHGRTHCDTEYGHQAGELNFWLPLTSSALTRTTLWAESMPGAGDFHPLAVDYGEMACFHGALCSHFAPPNESSHLRVSLDFRIGVGRFFDPEWRLPGVKAQHTWREVLL